MTEALDTVKRPLVAFTDGLSPEQKHRLDGMSEGQKADADLCSDHDEQFTDVPAQQIEAAVKPDQKQQATLAALKTASTKASQLLKAACPSGTPQSTAARLDDRRDHDRARRLRARVVGPGLAGDGLPGELAARPRVRPGPLGAAARSGPR